MMIKTAFAAFCLSATAAATPVSLSQRATEKCPSGNSVTRVNVTESYNLWPQEPNKKSDNVAGFEVETRNNASMLEHLAVFKGIPKEARTCQLGWAQGDRYNRVFIAKGNALMTVNPLTEQAPSADGVSYSAVKELVDTDADKLSPDFTNWDKEDEESGHIAGSIDCDSEIAIKVALNEAASDSHVYLQNDDSSGFYIDFWC